MIDKAFIKSLFERDSDDQLQVFVEMCQASKPCSEWDKRFQKVFLEGLHAIQEERVDKQLTQWATKGGTEVR